MAKVLIYLRLARPANILTAIADILAGFAVSGSVIDFPNWQTGTIAVLNTKALCWITLSTCGLYGGGIVFNDVFDAKLDKIERPERPIPSGKISIKRTIAWGSILLISGVVTACMVSGVSGLIALIIVTLAMIYNSGVKQQAIFGPVTMGACRAANFLLGVSINPANVNHYWYLSLISLFYIIAITLVSRGEVHGGNKKSLIGAVVLYISVIISLISLSLIPYYNFYSTLPVLMLFCFSIFPSLFQALTSLCPKDAAKAVKSGILSLIIMDATIATGFAGLPFGLLILLLWPCSIFMARKFAIT